jgi:hypothetical protein
MWRGVADRACGPLAAPMTEVVVEMGCWRVVRLNHCGASASASASAVEAQSGVGAEVFFFVVFSFRGAVYRDSFGRLCMGVGGAGAALVVNVYRYMGVDSAGRPMTANRRHDKRREKQEKQEGVEMQSKNNSMTGRNNGWQPKKDTRRERTKNNESRRKKRLKTPPPSFTRFSA